MAASTFQLLSPIRPTGTFRYSKHLSYDRTVGGVRHPVLRQVFVYRFLELLRACGNGHRRGHTVLEGPPDRTSMPMRTLFTSGGSASQEEYALNMTIRLYNFASSGNTKRRAAALKGRFPTIWEVPDAFWNGTKCQCTTLPCLLHSYTCSPCITLRTCIPLPCRPSSPSCSICKPTSSSIPIAPNPTTLSFTNFNTAPSRFTSPSFLPAHCTPPLTLSYSSCGPNILFTGATQLTDQASLVFPLHSATRIPAWGLHSACTTPRLND
ncbi:hypothetical protein NMY22_g2202 [Coprinellus aureogranulatus]|nr:hypothetical protein NMY22_g2202 [Coprinellus aureogranulatus]